MIVLSNEYKEKIISMFGSIGETWLNSIPNVIDKYIDKFELLNVKVLDNLTYNILFFADSKDFGPVVLKAEIPFKEMTIRETTALKLNNGKGACKCYYSNIDDGILIIERLLPGKSLNTINNIDEKIKIFSEVAESFNIKVENSQELPTYKNILGRSINMAHDDEQKFSHVKDLLAVADSLYKEIEEKNDSNYLLHSDLYCDNILSTSNGWKVIDPHGFIGNKILDSAIFVQKELEKSDFTDSNICNILELMEQYYDSDKTELCKALFINYVLNICWNIEVNLSDKHVDECVKRANIILDCINTKLNDNTMQIFDKKVLTKN